MGKHPKPKGRREECLKQSFGRYYKLWIVEDQEELLKFENAFYLSKSALSRAKEMFIEWYRREAFKKISERVSFYAKMGGFKYNKVNITNAEKRWGSCSPNGNLNFSWKLIMIPLQVVDYVVIHELAHLLERNHGKGFWTKIKTMLPNYEEYDRWLKERDTF